VQLQGSLLESIWFLQVYQSTPRFLVLSILCFIVGVVTLFPFVALSAELDSTNIMKKGSPTGFLMANA
jgi:hypothetical protein